MNSIHLVAERRDEFRLARAVLVASLSGSQSSDDRADQTWTDSARDSAATPDSGCELVLLRGQEKLALRVGVNTVGRKLDNDLILRDPSASRRHCAILVRPDRSCEIHDLASRNGTFVDGVRIDGPTPLTEASEIRIGDNRFALVRHAAQDSHLCRSMNVVSTLPAMNAE